MKQGNLVTKGKKAKQIVKAASVTLSMGFLPWVSAQDIVPRELEALAAPYQPQDFFDWGPIKVRPQASVTAYYDDNIRITDTGKESDFIWSFSPGVTFGLGEPRGGTGNNIALTYVPTGYIFMDHDENNSLDHDVSMIANWRLNRLGFSLGQAYQNASGTVVDVGDRVDRQIYTTTFGARYTYSDKTSFGVAARQSVNDYGALNSFNEWGVDGGFDYKVTSKLTMGAGAGYLVRDVVRSPNTFSEQVGLRSGYQVTGKLSVNANIGVEFRQYQGGLSDDPSLVYGLGASYKPRDGTLLLFETHRRDLSSVNVGQAGQNFTATGFSGSVRQRVFKKFFLGVSGGYEHSEYHSVIEGASAGRSDNYYFAGLSLDVTIYRKWAIGAFYQHRANESDGGFDFKNNQAGVRTSYRF